MILKCIFNA